MHYRQDTYRRSGAQLVPICPSLLRVEVLGLSYGKEHSFSPMAFVPLCS